MKINQCRSILEKTHARGTGKEALIPNKEHQMAHYELVSFPGQHPRADVGLGTRLTTNEKQMIGSKLRNQRSGDTWSGARL